LSLRRAFALDIPNGRNPAALKVEVDQPHSPSQVVPGTKCHPEGTLACPQPASPGGLFCVRTIPRAWWPSAFAGWH